MLNVRDIVTEAFRAVGAIQDGEPLDGDRTAVGVRMLNDIVSSFNLQGFFAFQRLTLDFIAPASSGQLTIGPVPSDPAAPLPDLAAQRPASVTSVYVGPSSTVMQSEVVQVAQSEMPNFAVSYGSGCPSRFCYISSYPLGKLWFDLPVPEGWTIRICYDRSIPPLSINDEVEIPPEYQPALTWALADALATRYMLPADTRAAAKTMRDRFVDSIRVNTSVKTPIHAWGGGGPGASTIYSRW